MSCKSTLSLLMGTPQLEQLNDDLREAEIAREAPRIVVSDSELQSMAAGKLKQFADIREVSFAAPREATTFDRVLGSFRLNTGGLGYFVSFPSAVPLSVPKA